MTFARFSMWQIKTFQYLALAGSVLLLPFVDWTWSNALVAVIVYYVYSGIGVSMMLHRYWTHREFEFKNSWVYYLFTAFAVLTARGSPLAWSHVHRMHHRHADTAKDPHQAGYSIKLFSFGTAKIGVFNPLIVKDLMTQKFHLELHNNYLFYLLLGVALISIGGLDSLYFGWMLPVCLTQLAQDLVNFYGHQDDTLVKDHSVPDRSKNVPWLFPLLLGEAWHNDHHRGYSSLLDPVGWLIRKVRL